MIALAQHQRRRYSGHAPAKSGTDLGRSSSQRRTSAPVTIAGAFFASAMLRYGGCAWDTFGCAGFLCDRSANPRTAVTIPCLAASGDGSKHKGAPPMQQLRNLRADSSLRTRLARYQHHITKARALEAVGGAQ